MKTSGNEPAMPLAPNTAKSECHSGLTKREHFAAMAMQGILSTTNIAHAIKEKLAASISKESVMMADALIEALNKEEQ